MILPAIISSVFEVCATQPLDVIKTHHQTNTKVIFSIKELYRGFVPRALGNIPSRSIFLFSQDYLKSYISQHNKFKFLLVPIGAGFIQTLFDTPVEVLKINKIMNVNNKFLYTGFLPHVMRNILFLVPVYNLREYSNKVNYTDKINKEKNIFSNALYGATGGVIGSYISHPLDTIKSRIQSKQQIDFKNITLRELYKGVHIRASMSLINMFVSLYVFELMKMFDVLN
jgi:hypothetical protein